MEQVLITLLEQNPWLVYPTVLASCVIVPVIGTLALIAFAQGRQIQFWIFTIGAKVADTPPAPPQPTPIHIHPEPAQIAPEQIEELAKRVAARVREIKTQEPESPPSRSSELPLLSKELDYLLRARLEIDRHLGRIVVGWGGGWAGVSLAPVETFLEYALRPGLISSQLGDDIKQFLYLTQILFSGGGTGGLDEEDAPVLAAHILQELERIKPEPGGGMISA